MVCSVATFQIKDKYYKISLFLKDANEKLDFSSQQKYRMKWQKIS
jgi:hypothetical protein